MYRISFRTLLILSAVSMAAPGRAADPADPQAAVPPLHYHSSMNGLRPGTSTPVGDWRAVNASVGQQGGHAHGAMMAGDREPAADAGTGPEAGHAAHDMHRHDMGGHGMHGHGEDMPHHCMDTAGHPGGHDAMPHAGHPDHPKEGGNAHRH